MKKSKSENSLILSILYGVIMMLLVCSSWVSCVVGLVMTFLLSLMLLHQNFFEILNIFTFTTSMGLLMMFLSIVLCLFALCATPMEKSSDYVMWILFLGAALICAFHMSNIILFYVFFEASLIPTLMLIIGWGYQPERLQAGSYMMLYTVTASLPLLLMLIFQSTEIGVSDIFMLSLKMNLNLFYPLSFILFLAFLVKLPMYSVHLWLPKAHVEAPLAGSMILAGILLKLGGYGMYLMYKSFNLVNSINEYFFISLCLWGGLLSILMCLRQVDIKSLVAYSSIGHMSIVAAGIFIDRSWGMLSATVTMVAHGFSSSALFCMAFYTYGKVKTRLLPYMGGYLMLFPSMSFFWFLCCCINMAAPGTINLVGEMFIMPSLLSHHFIFLILGGMMVFLSAAYNMYMYSLINHGQTNLYISGASPLRNNEKMIIFLHMVPLILILKLSLMM